jgi:hypothetical protein
MAHSLRHDRLRFAVPGGRIEAVWKATRGRIK